MSEEDKIKQLEQQLKVLQKKNKELWSDIYRLQKERSDYKRSLKHVTEDKEKMYKILTPKQRIELYNGSVCFAVEMKEEQ